MIDSMLSSWGSHFCITRHPPSTGMIYYCKEQGFNFSPVSLTRPLLSLGNLNQWHSEKHGSSASLGPGSCVYTYDKKLYIHIYTFTGANSSSRVTSTLGLGLGVMKLALGPASLYQSPKCSVQKPKPNPIIPRFIG